MKSGRTEQGKVNNFASLVFFPLLFHYSVITFSFFPPRPFFLRSLLSFLISFIYLFNYLFIPSFPMLKKQDVTQEWRKQA
jgi:hypothetical protein